MAEPAAADKVLIEMANGNSIDNQVTTASTYASLGEVIFEQLAGFTSFSDQDDATIAQYNLISGKPYPHAMAPNLREVSIGIRLHQRFVKVKEARLQLRAYKDNGSTLTLVWGNGEIEGRFLIQSISTGLVEQDNLGNVFCADLSLTLLEVPADNLLSEKQVSAYKKAFGTEGYSTPIVTPPVVQPSALAVFLKQLQKAMRYAALIESLAYGGRFPTYMGSSIGQIIQNAKSNSILMGQQFDQYGADWDIPDVSDNITDVTNSLTDMGALDPVTDAVAFGEANKAYQGHMRTLCS